MQIIKPYLMRITWQSHISCCGEFDHFHMLVHTKLTSKVMAVISEPTMHQSESSI